jgi:uncharacterized 2Fe-2S/4Fe-4S cluster protein (DUF4445 family)
MHTTASSRPEPQIPAGEGAKLALISKDMRGDAARISNEIEYVELTTDAEFQQRFADALIFG